MKISKIIKTQKEDIIGILIALIVGIIITIVGIITECIYLTRRVE